MMERKREKKNLHNHKLNKTNVKKNSFRKKPNQYKCEIENVKKILKKKIK